jgi:hypothetical protein
VNVPITLNVPDWGEVQTLTVKEAAKRLGVGINDIDYWVECDLFESYEWSVTDAKSGKLKKTIIYIDLADVADAEKLAKRFPPNAPWERVLWFRFEQQQQRRHVQPVDPRSTERTMVQPARPQRPEPPVQKRRPPLPPEIRDVLDEMGDEELLEELEGRQPSRPPQAKRLEPLHHQSVASAGRQRQRRQTIEEDDYYAGPDEPTVRDTNQYPRKKQLPAAKAKRGGWW